MVARSKIARHKSEIEVDDLTGKQAKAEYARLQAEIAAHDRRYYQDDAPAVSDAEYDALRRRYNEIEARFPGLRTLESLSLKVGAGNALISPHAKPKKPSGRDAVIHGSFCRNDPAAELRGLAKICPPVSAWRLLRARNACLVM